VIDSNFRPIVIMGAPRSGTNALRDALTSLPNFDTWPCDEINAIWKYRNLSVGYDNLAIDDLSHSKVRYIRNQFFKQVKKLRSPDFIVEKTCANTMRPRFVDGVLPEAKYIYIVRSGADVVKSATKRWRGEFEFNLIDYWKDKAKYIPVADLAYYFYEVVLKRLWNKLLCIDQLADWGPTHPTLSKLKGECCLEDVAALQWALCVISSWFYFRHSNAHKCIFVSYNVLLDNPSEFLRKFESLLPLEIASNDNQASFSANFFPPKPLANSYRPKHATVAKYFNSAMKIYNKINNDNDH